MDYSLMDLDGLSRYAAQETVSLGAREKKDGEILFELPKDSFGEFNFRVKLVEGDVEFVADKSIFLPSQTGLTGFAISDANRRVLSYLGIGILILVALIFVVMMVKKSKRRAKKLEVLRSGHFDNKKLHRQMTRIH